MANAQARCNDKICFPIKILLLAWPLAMAGCAAIPLKRLEPVVTPSPPCTSERFKLPPGEPEGFHYSLPAAAITGGRLQYISGDGPHPGPYFEDYHQAVQQGVSAKIPPGLKQGSSLKVVNALTEFFVAVSGGAQLDAQIADGTLNDNARIGIERTAIRKHGAPPKLTHGQIKAFSDKLFDLQLKPRPSDLTAASVHQPALSEEEAKSLSARPPLDQTFVKYFEAFYGGKFTDRMSTVLSKPKIATTIPDSEIVDAETVLLEFLVDAIDPTPVMGDSTEPPTVGSTKFYPGGTTDEPTAYSTGLAKYVQLPPGSKTACGITTQNVWVLRDLANGASGQAAAVGGLVANTPGGISLGLGVLGKISIGDNQTLSVLVKTAASRLALRATLASCYAILRHVEFNVSEP
jgi:hypothetical protein